MGLRRLIVFLFFDKSGGARRKQRRRTNADNAAARIYDVDLTLLNTGSGLLQLRVYDVSDNLNPLIKATVTDNTLIERDEF